MLDFEYDFPIYAQRIIDKLVERNWLIHSLRLDNKNDIYNPAGFLYNAEYNNLEYTIHLDLNIYQYVLSAYKKRNKKDLHRDAIALIVFAKFTNIIFDPTIAIYEKLNYLDECPDEIIDDLSLFRKIDNSNMDALADFALGYSNQIPLAEISPIERDKLKCNLIQYRRLKRWDTFYLFTLKITELYYFDNSKNEEKVSKFLDWCFKDFLYSLVAISFVLMLLGKVPLSKLMKYKLSMSNNDKRKSLVNMTWDLFLIDKFFEQWVQKVKGKEFLYASNDAPLKEVLEIAISIQEEGNGNHLQEVISTSLINKINEVSCMMKETEGRNINDVSDFKTYRDKLINQAETVVLS
ncbi:MAG: hypothetical protein HRU20_07705 [Pseudomonadales bacterium]|nr:hypothetical protein [Pseudomonadales bacterium]